MRNFKAAHLLSFLLLLLPLQGCVPIALTGAAIVAGVGVDHTLNGIVYKTFTSPLDNLQVATVKTLNRMEIKITEKVKTDAGWDIKATAMQRNIDIELEALTPNTTRMKVVANKTKYFLKDSATAREIIIQTADTLG